LDDALPVELDGLGKWSVGQHLLEAQLAGIAGADAEAAERARGALPPGQLAQPVMAEVRPRVDAIADAARQAVGDADPRSVDARVRLPDDRILNGTVAGVRGDVVATITYATIRAKHRLAAWVRLL